MHKSDLGRKRLPDAPGVYFFIGARQEILYIGKATSLKQRVGSYFGANLKEARSELIMNMVVEAKTVEVTATDSVLEALLLETNLIRTHKPRFNTKSKDDKSYNHLIVTGEEWPRILVVRGKDMAEKYPPDTIRSHYGPFPSGDLLRQALKIIRRLFKFYDTPAPVSAAKSKLARGRIDFNRQIGLYPKSGDRSDYLKTIHQIELFFEGKKQELIQELTEEMHKLAQLEAFERADLVKRRIFALRHIEDIALIKSDVRTYRDGDTARVEAYDIAHHGGQDMVGVMVVCDGHERRPAEYRKFIVRGFSAANDPGALQEVLRRRLKHLEWPLPQIIVVDGNAVQKRAAELVLREAGLLIPVVAVVKDERHKASRLIAPSNLKNLHQEAILLANAESHRFAISFHRRRRNKNALL